MIETKFRVWDTKSKKMLSYESENDLVFVIGCDGSIMRAGTNSFFDEFEWGCESEPTDELELMQYTGLKDKNGVEIYEGDILHSYNTSSPNILVEFQDGGFGVMNKLLLSHGIVKDDKWLPLTYCIDYGDVVIGNIYENPELLGGSNNQPEYKGEGK